jgi:uncharacterized protein (DUF1786 family)
VRTKGVSKALRDDYTAFNQAVVGYGMLYTTAAALGDQRTAGIAERHLQAYAHAVQEIAQVVPSVVVDELREEGLTVDDGAATRGADALNRAWRETSATSAVGQRAA